MFLSPRYQVEVITADQDKENRHGEYDAKSQSSHHALRVSFVPIHEVQCAEKATDYQEEQNYHQYFHCLVPASNHSRFILSKNYSNVPDPTDSLLLNILMLFRPSEIRFVPALVPTLAALCVFSLTLYLGHWQQARAAEKRLLQTEFEHRASAPQMVLGAAIADPLALRYTSVIARGEWLASGQIFLDNKFDNESVGFHVITPLKISGTDRYVLVNRGWVARGVGYPSPPSIPAQSGSVTVEGVLMLPSTRFLELTQTTVQGNVWQNLTIERYRAASNLDVLPLVLLAKMSDSPLKPVTERADARAEKHIEYMLTWYSLAATVAVLWVALNLKFERGLPQRPANSEGKQ